jgi:hypothetical protein
MKRILRRTVLTVLAGISVATSSLLASDEAEEWWRCPRDAGYARQEMERHFGSIPDSSIINFEISGVPVRWASIGWKTFGTDVTNYHWRTFDFLHNTLLYQSDY